RPEGEPIARVEDRKIPGPAGWIPLRIYWPATDGAARPGIVWYHGGGWVIGNLDGADYGARMLANAAGMVVISVDYRLAPESKFPAAADDAYVALEWAAQNANELGIDPDRIAVGGDSAGGNLAAVVANKAHKSGGPKVAFQALVYPVTHHSYDTKSYADNGAGLLLTRASMEWFWGHYLRSEADGQDPLASPLLEADLTGVAPALVITAEYDPLRDEGEAYAERLRDAGVKVESKRYAGQIHGFYANPAIDDGAAAVRQVAGALREALA
ncbi:MAG: alpha/beta hydrolase, partial [Tepidiformaceae bacterium]